MVTAIVGAGTPEAAWQSWPALHALPALELAGCTRALLVAPHPDDEVLGGGGLLRLLHKHGVRTEIVAVTDGGASHPDSPTVRPDELTVLRRAESRRALARLGLGAVPVHRLGCADGAVAESVVAARVTALLGEATGSTWCLATWRGDGHPDHEAVGRAAASACAQTGARLLEYPIWTWHWAAPADSRVPWDRARAVPLDAATRAAKVAAVDCFDSQVRPLSPHPADAAVLDEPTLQRLTRGFEVVFA